MPPAVTFGGVHLPEKSISAIDPVVKLISCSAMAGITPSYGGVHLPLESQSAIDPVVKLISCSAMAGISPTFTRGVHLPMVCTCVLVSIYL